MLQHATRVLMERWRPTGLSLTRTQFDEYDQRGRTSADRLDVHDDRVDLEALVDIASIVAADPIDVRVAVPNAHADATTLWFINTDGRQELANLLPAPELGPWRTRWFSGDSPLGRGFVLYVQARGQIDARWDRGIFATSREPSGWKQLDSDFDDWLTAQLRDLGFAEP